VTSYEVAALSEEEARTLFRRYRFFENGGEPFCPVCGSDAIWEYRCRNEFKCKACDERFTLTSKTNFAYRKLSYKQILSIAAEMNIAYQGRSAREILRNIRSIKNYKTIFVWVHKFRAALKRFQSTQTLSGEVEIDGVEVGGYIRPKNTKKERDDHRKFPYRASDRKMMVTVGRQRDGGARAWVCKLEHHAVPGFMSCLEPGAVVFSDCGNWGQIRDKFQLFQVPHRQTYYLPEASTNFCESANRIFRGMASIYRHITSTYLDLYAAQLAWRLSNIQMTVEEGFASLMRPMMDKARSEMAGYFLPKKKGGTKRRCEIILEDGSWAKWAPPTPEERRRARKKAGAADRPKTPTVRMARSKKEWKEGFTFLSAENFLKENEAIPIGPGVYALFFRDGDQLLASSGYVLEAGKSHWTHGDALHLYTGESYSLRKRLNEHLLGQGKTQNLRDTLMALEWSTGGVLRRPEAEAHQSLSDDDLSTWMRDQIVIGYKVCGHVREVERWMLHHAPSPLNIRDREPTPYSALLESIRKRYRARAAAS